MKKVLTIVGVRRDAGICSVIQFWHRQRYLVNAVALSSNLTKFISVCSLMPKSTAF
jgi:hypothetical protein